MGARSARRDRRSADQERRHRAFRRLERRRGARDLQQAQPLPRGEGAGDRADAPGADRLAAGDRRVSGAQERLGEGWMRMSSFKEDMAEYAEQWDEAKAGGNQLAEGIYQAKIDVCRVEYSDRFEAWQLSIVCEGLAGSASRRTWY